MKIITPIQPVNFGDFHALEEKINHRADYIEVWLDRLHDERFFELLGQTLSSDSHLIGCCKAQSEHGFYTGSQTHRIEILQQFLEAGGEFVDLDITQNTSENISKIPAEKLILSFHDFEGAGDHLNQVFAQMQKFIPAIYKFSVTTNTQQDLESFLNFAQSLPRDLKIIFSTMGQLGSEGRKIIREQNLSWAEFVALNESKKTAQGQRTLDEI